MAHLVSPDTIQRAYDRVHGSVHRTPLVSSRLLAEEIGAPLLLKCENLQRTGSFKVRGALNRVLTLPEDAQEAGVVTVSAGNHAQAVAWAATAAGIPSTVVMPESAPRAKVEASRGYGAEVVLHGSVFDAFQRALDLSESRGMTFLHPFDDPEVIAGQGTVGTEIEEQLGSPEEVGRAAGARPRALVVPVGGGGLISGIAAAWAEVSEESAPPRARIPIWGVEPEGAASMHESLRRGAPVRLDEVRTVADGLGSPMAGEVTYAHVRELCAGVVTVSDDEILDALSLLLTRTKLVTEPAGAAGVAALLSGRIPLEGEGPVVTVLSGGNLDLSLLSRLDGRG